MILPKGTVDFSKKGGEDSMVNVIENIVEDKKTGYILIMGKLPNVDGEDDDVTAQLLFQDGEPKLCEAVVNKSSHKGPSGTHFLLRSMMNPENEIEMHSKIDVGPPLAFFKECKFEPSDLDIEAFKKLIKEEEEERKHRDEERKRKEEKDQMIREEVEGWTTSGFKIEGFPEIMESSHEEIVKWYEDLSSNITEIRSILEWARKIEEVEVGDLRDQLVEQAKTPQSIDVIRKVKGDLEANLSDIIEKRKEMEKWVNLWRDEGYNTERIEESLNGDLVNAWNILTHFMDDIQKLKDHKEELENLKKDDPGDHFGSETREIDFLLNDPLEIENIERLITELKETMEKEKKEKSSLLKVVKEWEEKGYDLTGLEKHLDKRLDAFRTEQLEVLKNIDRMESMKGELEGLDRKDLADEIDALKEGLKDPYSISDHETELKALKGKVDVINSRRSALSEELEKLSEEGYNVESIRNELDSPIEGLESQFESFKADVKKLKALENRISDMDHRWLEGTFETLKPLLKEISKIDEIMTSLDDLQNKIDIREKERTRIRKEMEDWKGEGFIVSGLEEAIEDDLEVFSTAHKDLEQNITRSKDELASLRTMNVKFFPAEAQEIEKTLHDPKQLERTVETFESFKKKVSEDWNIRNKLRGRLDELKEKKWDIGDLETLMESSPDLIKERTDDLESRVSDLEGAMEKIESWDSLESNWLSEGISELREHLRRLEDRDGAMEHFQDLEEKINSNKKVRTEIISQMEDWKEAGYATHTAMEKAESMIEELEEVFNGLKSNILKLEDLQKRFDSLKIDHFRSEAEEIEFKLNDPYLVEEIGSEMEILEEKINNDEAKRDEFRTRIKDFLNEGFMAARNLESVLEEDISIVELEFRNFDKEVQFFKKYMESTGFVFPNDRKEDEVEPEKDIPAEEVENIPPEEPVENEEEQAVSPNDVELKTDGMDFSNFIVGTSNEIAYTAASDVASDPGNTYNPLLILGDEGVGKTHLLQAISGKIKEEKPNLNFLSISGEEFTEEMKNHRDTGKMEDFRDRFRNSDILVLDDLHILKDSEESQDMFANILNGFLDKNKQVVLSAEREIKSVPKLVDQIRARLDKGVSVDLEGTTPDLNKKIIEMIAGDKIPEEVSDYISTQLGDVRKVKKAVEELMAYGDMEGTVLEKAKEIVDKITGDPGHRKLTEALENTIESMKEKQNEVVLCTNCNVEIPADSTNCPNCGAIFEEVEMKECPVCKKHVEMEATSCPNCGMDF